MAEEEEESSQPSLPETAEIQISSQPCRKKVHAPQCYYQGSGFWGVASGLRVPPPAPPIPEWSECEPVFLKLDSHDTAEKHEDTGPPDYKICALALLLLAPPLGLVALCCSLKVRKAKETGQLDKALDMSRQTHQVILTALSFFALVLVCLVICLAVFVTYTPLVTPATTHEPLATSTPQPPVNTPEWHTQVNTPPVALIAIINNFLPINYSKEVPPVT